MKTPLKKPQHVSASKTPAKEVEPSPDKTLNIRWPWAMTWMESVDEMLEALKDRIGPGHPLHGRKLYVSAVREDERTWYVEGEEDDFYAIVYFERKKRYRGKMMPSCEILPDWDAVLKRFAADHDAAMKKLPKEA
jgi:hypothetical protein